MLSTFSSPKFYRMWNVTEISLQVAERCRVEQHPDEAGKVAVIVGEECTHVVDDCLLAPLEICLTLRIKVCPDDDFEVLRIDVVLAGFLHPDLDVIGRQGPVFVLWRVQCRCYDVRQFSGQLSKYVLKNLLLLVLDDYKRHGCLPSVLWNLWRHYTEWCGFFNLSLAKGFLTQKQKSPGRSNFRRARLLGGHPQMSTNVCAILRS